MLKFDEATLNGVVKGIQRAQGELRSGKHFDVLSNGFTTSPSLGAVSAQYGSYLTGHPGSLSVTTAAAVSNVQWLHDAMIPLIEALQEQELTTAEAFDKMMDIEEAGTRIGIYSMPPRVEQPVLDLAYVPPVAAIESTTPLKALTVMFAGDDSGIIAASESWRAAGRRMTQAAESLQSATSLLEGATEGAVFRNATQAIGGIAAQCATVSANSTAMANSMMQLPPIRATAHAKLIAMEAEIAAEATAVGAATGGAGTAAVVARSQAQVAAFVSTYLQPALDTARPVVTNLTVPVTGHTGGGALDTGAAPTMAANETITQVAGGATTPSGAQVAQQTSAVAQQAGQVGAAPAGATQAAPVSAAPPAPTGGTGPAPAAAGPAASPATMPAGQRTTPATPAAPGASTTPVRPTPAGAMGPVSTGTPGGLPRTPGAVAQPLLPRAVSMSSPGGPATGVPGHSGPATGVGSGAAHGSPAARGGSPGVPGAAAAGGQAAGGHRGGAGTGMLGTPMAGGAGMNNNARKNAAPTVFGKGPGRHRGAATALGSYFQRQFLGTKAKTVKKVIR